MPDVFRGWGMTPAKRVLLGLVLAAWPGLLAGAPVWAKVAESTRLLERSASLRGSTGWMNIPAAAVPTSGELALSIHRADASVNAGFLDILEVGAFFKVDQLGTNFAQYRDLSSWDRVQDNVPAFFRESFKGQAKLKLLDQDWAGVGLAAGLEEQDAYVVVQRYLPGLSRVTLVGGWGQGRFRKGFGGLNKTIQPGSELMFEYDGEGVNAGLRVLLAQHVIFTLAMQNLNTIGEVQNLGEVIGDHFMFGITYVERLW